VILIPKTFQLCEYKNFAGSGLVLASGGAQAKMHKAEDVFAFRWRI